MQSLKRKFDTLYNEHQALVDAHKRRRVEMIERHNKEAKEMAEKEPKPVPGKELVDLISALKEHREDTVLAPVALRYVSELKKFFEGKLELKDIFPTELHTEEDKDFSKLSTQLREMVTRVQECKIEIVVFGECGGHKGRSVEWRKLIGIEELHKIHGLPESLTCQRFGDSELVKLINDGEYEIERDDDRFYDWEDHTTGGIVSVEVACFVHD